MNANTMELNPEQLEQITGADVMGMETRYPDDCCHYPHAVKTSWQREDEFFHFLDPASVCIPLPRLQRNILG